MHIFANREEDGLPPTCIGPLLILIDEKNLTIIFLIHKYSHKLVAPTGFVHGKVAASTRTLKYEYKYFFYFFDSLNSTIHYVPCHDMIWNTD